MIICSHSTPSSVIGFEGLYYTEYIEYTCGDSDCTHYKKKKYRAPNPWRVDRHRYDCEVEAAVVHQHFQEQKTYQEIEMFMKLQYGMKISQRTIGNIMNRYEIACKLAHEKNFSTEFKKNGGIFIGVDTITKLYIDLMIQGVIGKWLVRTTPLIPIKPKFCVRWSGTLARIYRY